VALAVLAFAGAALAANISGTNGPDFIVGTPQNDNIEAFGGEDTVYGKKRQ